MTTSDNYEHLLIGMKRCELRMRYRQILHGMLPKQKALVAQLDKLFLKFGHQIFDEREEHKYVPVKDIVDEINTVQYELYELEEDYRQQGETLLERGSFAASVGESRMMTNLEIVFESLRETFPTQLMQLMSNIPFADVRDRDIDRKFWDIAKKEKKEETKARVRIAINARKNCRETLDKCHQSLGVVEDELPRDPPTLPFLSGAWTAQDWQSDDEEEVE